MQRLWYESERLYGSDYGMNMEDFINKTNDGYEANMV